MDTGDLDLHEAHDNHAAGEDHRTMASFGLLYIAANVKKHRNDQVKVLDAFCMNLDGDQLVELAVKESQMFSA